MGRPGPVLTVRRSYGDAGYGVNIYALAYKPKYPSGPFYVKYNNKVSVCVCVCV